MRDTNNIVHLFDYTLDRSVVERGPQVHGLSFADDDTMLYDDWYAAVAGRSWRVGPNSPIERAIVHRRAAEDCQRISGSRAYAQRAMRMREATFVRRGIVASSGPMEVFGAFVLWLIIGTFVGVLVTFSKSQFDASTKTWADFARSRQMAMTSARFFPFRPNVISGVIENVPIQLDHDSVSHGKSSTADTRVVSRAVEPMPFTSRVYVESVFSSL